MRIHCQVLMAHLGAKPLATLTGSSMAASISLVEVFGDLAMFGNISDGEVGVEGGATIGREPYKYEA